MWAIRHLKRVVGLGILVMVVAACGQAGIVQAAGQGGSRGEMGAGDREVHNFLERQFCDAELCPQTGWQDWIIVDKRSAWTVNELASVRHALSSTLRALAAHGLDGQAILTDYRFRRPFGWFLPEGNERRAVVNHGEKEIRLAGAAFESGLNGFPVYHELGHVIDAGLGRRSTAVFHELSGGVAFERSGEKRWATKNGYWIRNEARTSRTEATADALAVWVMSEVAGLEPPVFHPALAEMPLTPMLDAVHACLQEESSEPLSGLARANQTP